MSLIHWNVGITYTLSHTRDLHRNLFVAILPSTYLLPRILTKFTSRIHWNVGITYILEYLTRDLHRNLFVAILPSTYLLLSGMVHWNVGITYTLSISHVICIEILLRGAG
jgi:hypothetical protein